MSYTIEDIARIIGARRIGDRPAAIDWLLTDSRSLSFPEETLFFALPTERNDGTRYIRDLYARGVRNFVVSEERLNEVGIGEPKVEDAARQETVDTAAMQPAFNLRGRSQPVESLAEIGRATSGPVSDSCYRHYRQQRKNHCERVAASVAESRTDDNTLSPQLQFPDRRTFVRVADE